jgi:flagellar basal-body rod protein FlgB
MADVSGISFGQTVDLLGNAMRGADLENDQISNNIANVNTPNFRRSTTSFRDALAASLGTPADPDALAMKTSDDRQFAIGAAVDPVAFDPKASVDESIQMRVDRSNVDIDQEMARLSANSGYEQTMTQLLQAQYKRLREAIQEQPT